VLRVRGEAARQRGLRSAPAGASDVDGATAHLRMAGLTWRELDIVRRLSLLHQEGEDLDRTALADRLGLSPNTLRVHLTRIRAKLDVGEKRGDEAILEAVKKLPASDREQIS
jgi:DNA-binding CsgD family transcriptional regulator